MGRVVILHPDLGLGGAERLIVDAARALKTCGHHVTIYTGYHDKNRCFEETRDGTLRVRTVGTWIPRNILGRLHALMAYFKMMYIALYVVIFAKYDVALCDQVSACIPVLKFRPFTRIVFYCHFPDQLLTTRDSLFKKIYRKPLDFFEEWSTSLADAILVNSRFTRKIVENTFNTFYMPRLIVVYPCVDVNKFRESEPKWNDCKSPDVAKFKALAESEDNYIFLSLNRFERKKDISFAIDSLRKCLDDASQSNSTRQLHLIIAGGLDQRLSESVEYYRELQEKVDNLNLREHVTFIKSPDEDDKLRLLSVCHTVLYTPENEHFGIVPIEAMAMSKPVIARASGGPAESIVHKETGYLEKANFDSGMLQLANSLDTTKKMGLAGFQRVSRFFSFERFRDQLNRICFPPR